MQAAAEPSLNELLAVPEALPEARSATCDNCGVGFVYLSGRMPAQCPDCRDLSSAEPRGGAGVRAVIGQGHLTLGTERGNDQIRWWAEAREDDAAYLRALRQSGRCWS